MEDKRGMKQGDVVTLIRSKFHATNAIGDITITVHMAHGGFSKVYFELVEGPSVAQYADLGISEHDTLDIINKRLSLAFAKRYTGEIAFTVPYNGKRFGEIFRIKRREVLK